MAEVIGIRFRSVGKVYYSGPDGDSLRKGDMVTVETSRGMEYGEAAMGSRQTDDEGIVQPLKRPIRITNRKDLKRFVESQVREKSAFEICNKKTAAHELETELMGMEYTFDNSKVLSYFIADGRVDLHELVKDSAPAFRTRIELRQIGMHDGAKMPGSLGICRRSFCCSTSSGSFQPVFIKTAEEQNFSSSPAKIPSTCGRLMCRPGYEQEAYLDLLRTAPKLNAIVMTPGSRGTVVDQNLLTGVLQIRLGKAPDTTPFAYRVRDVRFIKDAQLHVNRAELDQLRELGRDWNPIHKFRKTSYSSTIVRQSKGVVLTLEVLNNGICYQQWLYFLRYLRR